jgi:hypothetical protein
MIQVDKTVLEGEVVYDELADRPVTSKVDFAAMDDYIARLHKVCAKLGFPPSGTIIEGSIAHPVTDPARLIGNEVKNG